MPGWFGFAKKNEVHQWPESCLGSPGKKTRDVNQDLFGAKDYLEKYN